MKEAAVFNGHTLEPGRHYRFITKSGTQKYPRQTVGRFLWLESTGSGGPFDEKFAIDLRPIAGTSWLYVSEVLDVRPVPATTDLCYDKRWEG
jgi:hypothetical protein